jgi:exodeoxyribonuclease V alpha subunit
MTGGPGVGKTTIVNAILRILAAKGINLLLCAPGIITPSKTESSHLHRLLPLVVTDDLMMS